MIFVFGHFLHVQFSEPIFIFLFQVYHMAVKQAKEEKETAEKEAVERDCREALRSIRSQLNSSSPFEDANRLLAEHEVKLHITI